MPRMRAALVAVAAVALASCVVDVRDADVVDDGPDVDAAASVEAALRTNSDPNRIVVVSNNIENMIFDWKDLVFHMETSALRPDVFLVQQVSDKAELDRLIAFMGQRLGVDYDGVVAQDVPSDHRFGGEVLPRPRVTTGVIWRAARFSLVKQQSWMPFGRGFRDQPKTCSARSNHSGYETLRVKLHDDVADEDIVAVSLRNWTWHPCSAKNMKLIVDGEDDHAGLGARSALHIVGGDFNDRVFAEGGGYACWYRQMNGDLGPGGCADDVDHGFTDPLYVACDGDVACMRRRGGIDSLFVRRSDGVRARADHFDIVSYDDGDRAHRAVAGRDGASNRRARDGYDDVASRYSGHRARVAYVYYR